MDSAFDYVAATPLETESQYPYTGRDGKCSAKSGSLKVSSHVDVAANSPTAL